MDEEGADVEDEDSGRNKKKYSGKMLPIHFSSSEVRLGFRTPMIYQKYSQAEWYIC